jgi:hypothetical protein
VNWYCAVIVVFYILLINNLTLYWRSFHYILICYVENLLYLFVEMVKALPIILMKIRWWMRTWKADRPNQLLGLTLPTDYKLLAGRLARLFAPAMIWSPGPVLDPCNHNRRREINLLENTTVPLLLKFPAENDQRAKPFWRMAQSRHSSLLPCSQSWEALMAGHKGTHPTWMGHSSILGSF